MAAKTNSTKDHTPSSEWIIPIKTKLSVLRERSLRSSIFKVPNKLRQVDEDAYSPRIVAIGPFHSTSTHKNDHLLAMEENKWWYMLHLLNRTSKEKEILAEWGATILNLEKRVRLRYAESIELTPQELAEIMLVDGCFILELFLRFKLKKHTEEDPIFHNAWMVPTLRRDLALLENQIPLFILKHLFAIIVPHLEGNESPASINDLALSFFFPGMDSNQKEIIKRHKGTSCQADESFDLHFLDFLHDVYVPTSLEEKYSIDNETRPGLEKCATQLLQAGIKFEKPRELLSPRHLVEMSFSEARGIITIPPLCIDKSTKSLLRNFIAFEQCLGSTQQHITSYAILLQCLIRSPADIELLEKEGIITNKLGTAEDVLTLFNNILSEVVPNYFYFGQLCRDVNAYQMSLLHWPRLIGVWNVRGHRYMAVLRSDYFSSPWSLIAFIAAVVGLFLTAVQTFYAVYRS